MWKKALFVVVLILFGVTAWGVELFWSAGQFKTIRPHFSGTCRVVPGVVGPEDITIDARHGVAWISATDRRAVVANMPGQGGIYAYSLDRQHPAPVKRYSVPGFQPHGLSLWTDEQGQSTLFVVNHADNAQTIEVFDVQADGLTHTRTVAGPALVSPNDVLGVDHDRFYVSNDHRYRTGARRLLEDYARLSVSNLVYYDGQAFSEVASDLAYANGVNLSPDGRTVYVSTTIGQELRVYQRNSATGALTLERVLPMGTGLDNIEIGPDGALWIAAHPKLLSFVAYSRDPHKRSPSQILRVEPGDGTAEEVFLGDGEELSGSSVGAVFGDRLLIGSVFDDALLDCRMAG